MRGAKIAVQQSARDWAFDRGEGDAAAMVYLISSSLTSVKGVSRSIGANCEVKNLPNLKVALGGISGLA